MRRIRLPIPLGEGRGLAEDTEFIYMVEGLTGT